LAAFQDPAIEIESVADIVCLSDGTWARILMDGQPLSIAVVNQLRNKAKDKYHYITSHHITSYHITSYHITSHHMTYHITSHHITSHHITSPHYQASSFILSLISRSLLFTPKHVANF
jgi:hypothetical protein